VLNAPFVNSSDNVTGVFSGRIVGVLRGDRGIVVKGFTGPHRVAVPMKLFLGKRPDVGTELTYVATVLPGGRPAIATKLIRTRSRR
jgi:hypothetical protein